MGHPGFFLLPVTCCGATEPKTLPLCNYKTAHNKATKIAQAEWFTRNFQHFGIAYLT